MSGVAVGGFASSEVVQALPRAVVNGTLLEKNNIISTRKPFRIQHSKKLLHPLEKTLPCTTPKKTLNHIIVCLIH